MELMNHKLLHVLAIKNVYKINVKKKRPRRDSNPQSSDSKSDALSIRPRGRLNVKLCIVIYIWNTKKKHGLQCLLVLQCRS